MAKTKNQGKRNHDVCPLKPISVNTKIIIFFTFDSGCHIVLCKSCLQNNYFLISHNYRAFSLKYNTTNLNKYVCIGFIKDAVYC